ncbi:hypothetical protein T265_09354 [Opisthorchis viverrini]|uniref:VWFC domain-containing protein n=1 Tax=Opisthorchis viverrini TaxID=6198 RepID=A0A074Z688_OPIVI|nr:hypothetical protein T265_09354 [Opisthorchis viverrini]KER22593.1 hypothetical protein T265_09354 [Opisthorchis viverrini]
MNPYARMYLTIAFLLVWRPNSLLSVLGQRSCELDDGRVLKPGEEIQYGLLPCMICRCDGNTGKAECRPHHCPDINCGADEGQLVEPGACCPTCVCEFVWLT